MNKDIPEFSGEPAMNAQSYNYVNQMNNEDKFKKAVQFEIE